MARKAVKKAAKKRPRRVSTGDIATRPAASTRSTGIRTSARYARPMASISPRAAGKDMMLKTLLAETGTDSLHAYLSKHHK